jgi:hypothetical protein
LNLLQLRRSCSQAAAFLARGESAEDIARLLRRWDQPGEPALLIVLDWDTHFADVYPAAELREEFPDAPLVPVGSNDDDGGDRVLVYVIDEDGETAYAIPDPRAWD